VQNKVNCFPLFTRGKVLELVIFIHCLISKSPSVQEILKEMYVSRNGCGLYLAVLRSLCYVKLKDWILRILKQGTPQRIFRTRESFVVIELKLSEFEKDEYILSTSISLDFISGVLAGTPFCFCLKT